MYEYIHFASEWNHTFLTVCVSVCEEKLINVLQVWAVKWYRGNFEIFRFIQEESPPTKIFPLDHFHIDVSYTHVVHKLHVLRMLRMLY